MPLSPSPTPTRPEPGESGVGAPLGADSGWRPFGWAVLIALLALQVIGLYGPPSPGPVDTGAFPGADKLGHVIGFAVPTFVAVLLRSRWVLVVLVVHALVAELIQGWLTDDRVMDAWDAVANVGGLALGVVAGVMVMRGRRG